MIVLSLRKWRSQASAKTVQRLYGGKGRSYPLSPLRATSQRTVWLPRQREAAHGLPRLLQAEVPSEIPEMGLRSAPLHYLLQRANALSAILRWISAMASAHIFSPPSVSATMAKANIPQFCCGLLVNIPRSAENHLSGEIYPRKSSMTFWKKLSGREVKKEFLTLAEVKQLVATPARYRYSNKRLCSVAWPVCVSAIFCNSRGNISRWDRTEVIWFAYVLKKTEEETNLPVSDETLALCGERSEGLVFKGLKRHMVNHPLKEWLKSAGITRRISFHSMRHSFATLLAANGIDILTISKMLTHKSVKNTQIYAKVVDERAREAANVISLKWICYTK